MGTWVIPAAYLLGIGWFFATALIAGVGIGHWVDSKTGLEPTFTLIGIFMGLAVALYGGARMLMPFMRRYGSSGPSEKD